VLEEPFINYIITKLM